MKIELNDDYAHEIVVESLKDYHEVMSYGALKAHDFYAAASALGESGE